MNGMTSNDISRMVKRRMKAACLSDRYSPHSFRVTAITDLLNQGVSLSEVLERAPDPSEGEIRDALSGNLCRCTGYQEIVDAALEAAAELRGDRITLED